MTSTSKPASADALCIWSAAYVPHGTPMRHTVDANEPEIRLIIGSDDRVELTMDPMAAGEMVLTLRRAVRDFNAAHGFPTGPEVA